MVQAINFLVVYWLLRIFLFKPTISVIEQEQSEKAVLTAAIDQQKKSIEIQEKERERYVFMCRDYFLSHRPIVGYYEVPFLFSSVITEQELSSVSLDKKSAIVFADVYKALEEKIKNVH